MSEQDNLPQADGTEENKLPISEESQQEETPISEVKEVPKEDDEMILEIDDSNAEDAEDEGNQERHSIVKKDYEKMSMEALVEELEKLVKNEKVQAIKTHVEDIRSEFKSKFGAFLDEKKEEFLHNGGNEIDFYYSSPLQKQFKEVYQEYRAKLNSHYSNLEKSLKDNLAEREDIIEEIKGLLNVEENINSTYKHFKELQDRWKHAGPIPRDKYNNTWNNYHHHVERFYDFLHLNRDLRDLDFKHNLDQKLKIIERAEELAQIEDVNFAFRELQVLHKMWKEELGPVGKEHREEVWNKFKEVTKSIHDKRAEHFAILEKDYEKNLEKKHELISQIEAITASGANSHNEWQQKIKEIEVLREEFFSAGKVPIKVNEATWSKFKQAVRTFNRKKNAFYKNLKKDQYDNLQKKLDLIQIAEDNQDNDDFEATTPIMKKIQTDWKHIGHVPRKNSDKIWKQFKTACNHYFDRLHAAKNEANKEEFDAYNKKNDILKELKSIELSNKKEDNLELVKSYIAKWQEAGNVPPNKRYIEGKLNNALDQIFRDMKIDKTEAEMIKFDNKLEVLNNEDNSRRLDNERVFIRKKIQEVQSEITQLENNLQFFSNVDETNPMVKEVLNNIQKYKDSLDLWKTKLEKIKELY